jgi:hypothetical protein
MDTIDFADRLLRGEKFLWSGRPAQGLLFTGRDWFLVPFSLMWGGFAIFWEAGVLATPAPLFMKFWGVPFVLLGVYFVAGRFMLDAWIRRGMSYAVTNRRVLIFRPSPFGKFTSLSLEQAADASLSERADGRGTIRFGQQTSLWSSGGRGGGFGDVTPALDPTPQFIAIENARRVYDLIQTAAGKTD